MNIIFIILLATLTYLCVWTAAKVATWNCHKLMRDFSLSSKNVKIHTLTSWKLASASRCLSTLTFIFKKKKTIVTNLTIQYNESMIFFNLTLFPNVSITIDILYHSIIFLTEVNITFAREFKQEERNEIEEKRQSNFKKKCSSYTCMSYNFFC